MTNEGIKTEKKEMRLSKAFPICSVCRDDVAYAIMEIDPRKLTLEQARKRALRVSDAVMVHLAGKMANCFGDTGDYDEALKEYIRNYI
jgi:hypothetical protein